MANRALGKALFLLPGNLGAKLGQHLKYDMHVLLYHNLSYKYQKNF